MDSINPPGRSASGWQAQNWPPVITHKSTPPFWLSSPSAPASGGMKRVSGYPLPGRQLQAAGSQSLLQKALSTLQKQVEADSVQSPFPPEAPWTGAGRLPLPSTPPPPLQPRAAHSHTTSIAPPDVSLTQPTLPWSSSVDAKHIQSM